MRSWVFFIIIFKDARSLTGFYTWLGTRTFLFPSLYIIVFLHKTIYFLILQICWKFGNQNHLLLETYDILASTSVSADVSNDFFFLHILINSLRKKYILMENGNFNCITRIIKFKQLRVLFIFLLGCQPSWMEKTKWEDGSILGRWDLWTPSSCFSPRTFWLFTPSRLLSTTRATTPQSASNRWISTAKR